MTPADVTFQRDEYTAALPVWAKVRDACAGSHAVKAKRETYLPKPNPHDESAENRARYDSYLARAVYFNATGRTLAGLVGIAFRRWPEVEVPGALEYLRDDADGQGIPLVGQSQQAVQDVLQAARAGLLVDYPPVAAPASRADQAAGNIRATISLIRAEQITNWRMVRRGARSVLGLLVIKESVEEGDGFGLAVIEQYRVLKIGVLSTDAPGAAERYVVELWRKNAAGEWALYQELQPLDGAGRVWDEIPFTFIGATNNDAGLDQPPLYDIAELNLAHFRNSADYEDSAFFVGQPQFWMSGLDQTWVDMLEKKGVYVGSRAILPLPVGGAAGILQAQPNTLAGSAMALKQEQMAALGARLLQKGEAVKTAEQSRSETAAAHSVLSLVCDNVSAAYLKALGWVARFMNATGEVDFAISTEFAGVSFDAQALTALVGAWQAGAITQSDLFTTLRSMGLADEGKTDEELRDELQTAGAGLNLDDPAA